MPASLKVRITPRLKSRWTPEPWDTVLRDVDAFACYLQRQVEICSAVVLLDRAEEDAVVAEGKGRRNWRRTVEPGPIVIRSVGFDLTRRLKRISDVARKLWWAREAAKAEARAASKAAASAKESSPARTGTSGVAGAGAGAGAGVIFDDAGDDDGLGIAGNLAPVLAAVVPPPPEAIFGAIPDEDPALSKAFLAAATLLDAYASASAPQASSDSAPSKAPSEKKGKKGRTAAAALAIKGKGSGGGKDRAKGAGSSRRLEEDSESEEEEVEEEEEEEEEEGARAPPAKRAKLPPQRGSRTSGPAGRSLGQAAAPASSPSTALAPPPSPPLHTLEPASIGLWKAVIDISKVSFSEEGGHMFECKQALRTVRLCPHFRGASLWGS